MAGQGDPLGLDLATVLLDRRLSPHLAGSNGRHLLLDLLEGGAIVGQLLAHLLELALQEAFEVVRGFHAERPILRIK